MSYFSEIERSCVDARGSSGAPSAYLSSSLYSRRPESYFQYQQGEVIEIGIHQYLTACSKLASRSMGALVEGWAL